MADPRTQERRARDRTARARPRWLRRVLLGLVVVVVLLGAVMAWQAWSASRSAEAGNDAVTDFRARLLDGDVPGAEKALARAQEETTDVRSSLGGPLWAAAGRLPGVGDDVVAARRLAITTDDVTHGALPAVTTALSYADPRDIGLANGRVELGSLREASGQLARAATLLTEADDEVGSIETAGLTGELQARVVQTQDVLDETSRLARTAAIAGRLLPDMLGGDGRRDYLILAQNTAEQRSLGGIVGAAALLRVEDGRLRLLRQVTGADFPRFGRPVLELTDAERALYGPVLGQYLQNVTDTPDFPRAAELVTQMWQRRVGGKIDGVAAIDPWALQLLLRVVGPVETDAGRLTGRNATQRLLVDVYADVEDPAQQDEVFAQAARRVFERVTTFRGDPRALTGALTQGVAEGRVMLWSARRPEQRILERIPLGRTLYDTTQASPRLGVYLHDRVGSKMSSYQRVAIDTRPESCGPTTRGATTTVRIRSTAPLDRDLPAYVTGEAEGIEPADLLTQVVVYAPPGWSITGVSSSDGRDDLVTYRHDGLWAGTRDVRVAPGKTVTMRVRMGGESLSSDLDVRYTPGTKPANVRVEGSGCS